MVVNIRLNTRGYTFTSSLSVGMNSDSAVLQKFQKLHVVSAETSGVKFRFSGSMSKA